MLRISRKFVAIQMKSSYNGHRNIYFIRLYAWSYYRIPFNSRLRVRSTSYLNSPGYEIGFRCVKWLWSLPNVSPRAFWSPRVCQQTLDRGWSFPRGGIEFASFSRQRHHIFYILRRGLYFPGDPKTRKSTGTSSRIESNIEFLVKYTLLCFQISSRLIKHNYYVSASFIKKNKIEEIPRPLSN